MSTLLKVLAGIAALLLLIAAAAAIYITTLFDPNDYKGEIQALVKRQTQLELAIAGDLELSLFPWLGVKVEDVTLDAPEAPLARIGQARVFAKFWPLLRGELEVDGITLRDVSLNLVVDTHGRSNWLPGRAASEPGTPKTSDRQVSPAVLPLAAFQVGQVTIENADISYRNLAEHTFHQLQNLQLQVSQISEQSRFPVSADLRYFNHLINQPVHAHLTTRVDLNLPEQTLSLEDLVLDVADARLRASLQAQNILQQPAITAQLALSEVQPAFWASLLNQPGLEGLTAPLALQTRLSLDTGKGALALPEWQLSSSYLSASGSLQASQLNTAPAYQGELTLKQLAPRLLLSQLGIEILTAADPAVMKTISGQLQLEGTTQSLRLPQLTLQLDDTRLEGNAEVSAFTPLATRFDLSADRLNLDRYQVTEAAMPPQPSGKQTVAPAEALLLPLALLRDINTQGRLRLSELTVAEQSIKNIDARVSARSGLINLDPISAALFGGALQGKARIDARSDTPHLSLQQSVKNVQMAPLLKTLADTDLLTGALNLQLNASALGNTPDAIKRSLDGEAEFTVHDGVLRNINIDQLVCQGIARIRDRSFTPDKTQPHTPFQEIRGHQTIVKGVIHTDRLQIALKNLQVTGSGRMDLPAETLDYLIRAKLHGDLENPACEVHERYRDIAWPVRCQGKFSDDPAGLCRLDQQGLQQIAAQLAQEEIKRKAGEEIDRKLKEKLGEEPAEQLKKLFGL